MNQKYLHVIEEIRQTTVVTPYGVEKPFNGDLFDDKWELMTFISDTLDSHGVNRKDASDIATFLLNNENLNFTPSTCTQPKDTYYNFYNNKFETFSSDKDHDEYGIVYDGFFGNWKITTMTESMKSMRIEALKTEAKYNQRGRVERQGA